MSDFVLRGFCKKCGQQINWDTKENYTDCPALILIKMAGPCEPIWFLSAKQMDTIAHSDEYWKWANGDEHEEAMNINYIINFLNREPFLVSKILKDAGEKESTK